MIKKIIIGIFLAGMIGVLIWGGVNRTLARSVDHSSNNQENKSRGAGSSNGEASGGRWGQQSSQVQIENNNNQTLNRKGTFKELDSDCANSSEYNETFQYRGVVEQNNSQQQANPERGDSVTERNNNANRGGNGRAGRNNGSGNYQIPLTDSEIQALQLALEGEYHALATYSSVIDTFGDVEPFSSIMLSEQRHVSALINQFTKYSIPVPENPWLSLVPVFDSISEACKAGVEVEKANALLYEELFNRIENETLIRVFSNLSRASLESHLPEYEACQ